MPIFSEEYLRRVTYTIFRALDASDEEASTVARHVVKANLVGHDSHGVMLVPVYAERIQRGHIVPGAALEVTRETASSACVDGNWGFGYVVTERAMGMAIEKAKANNVAAFTVFRQSHIGRLGDYAVMAADAGMIGLITADSGQGPKSVAPYGGVARRLGTNPICIAVPSELEGTVLLDMATAAVALGKINLALSRKEAIPPTWVIDKDGNATSDPNAFHDGGAILPVGADQAHKGSGLSFMVEVLSGLLTGLGFGIDPQARHNDGCFLFVLNVEAFRPLAEFTRDVKEFAEFIKSSPPAKGFSEVLYPGEIEWRTEQQRSRDSIYVEDETWGKLSSLVDQLGIGDAVSRP